MLLQLQDQIEQVLAVILVKRGRRFIENEQLDLLGERLGDFHELLLADSDVDDMSFRGFL
ncbi:hypothetical protein D3C77_296310 [compost metagenome]